MATGAVDEFVVRDAYGVRAELTALVVPFGYTGHAEDPTGLVWGRARYLDTAAGRFLAEDGASREPRYCYVGGRPVMSRDPTGLAEAVQVGVISTAQAAPVLSSSQLAAVGAAGGLGALGVTLKSELDCLGHFLACLATPLGRKRANDPQYANMCAECLHDCNPWTGWPPWKKCQYSGL
jgi:RHS repeat-associated protein